MENNRVSNLLRMLEEGVVATFGKDRREFKFIYGNYLSEEEHPQIIGESLNVVSAVGLNKFATISLVYSQGGSSQNEICLYPSEHQITLGHLFKLFLRQEGLSYRERCENV